MKINHLLKIVFLLSSLILSAQENQPAGDSNTVAADTIVVAADTIKVIEQEKPAEKDSTTKGIIERNLKPPVKFEELFSFSKVIWSVIFFVVGFYVIKLITTLLNRFSERSTKYRITLKGLIPIFRILGWTAIILLVIVGIFRPPVETVVLVAGSLGIAIGFAAQDILKNIFGGIMIIFDRAFQVGDKIQVGSHYGEVIGIGLRSTRIVTADDSMVVIPNAEIVSQSISNSNSGEPNCQVVAEIFLPAYVDTEKVKQIAIRAAQVSKYVYLNKPVAVIFKNEISQDRSVLKMRLKAYVFDIRFEFPFMSEMTELTLKEIISKGIVSKEELNGLVPLNN
ncbi:MAG: mechanosensitive ion channel family protein [Melioribacteraceae bacterium]|nr:mechanosensitive ion channel family protein [Melioribacteraceae bacterium]MCF8354976.1 mechanosensitive ion channel family protein [Melioribacteraceae bacterium]MCF8394007.1 mechanosensitive ion channel family protein [Melioribacteraceae bacterium]MCF8419790.1 mechanosensitive ion channel family protein [Melioribacteraceae bacterium]